MAKWAKWAWNEYRYGTPKKPTLARVFKGEAKQHVVNAIIDELADWRLSKFQHEASCRHGIRSALCTQGHAWSRADIEADLLVQEGLSRIHAVRPSYAEGQRHYTVPRENCAWCAGEIEQGNWKGQRFCSSMCANSALEHRVFGDQYESEAIRLSAYRLIRKEKAPARECKFCGLPFQSSRKGSAYCSPRCVRGARGDFHGDKDCAVCGKTFHPQRMSIKCCSNECAGAYRVREYRAAYPERACDCCGTIFRPSKPWGRRCSRRCTDMMSNRFKSERKKAAIGPSNVIYLTAEIFDRWFKCAA